MDWLICVNVLVMPVPSGCRFFLSGAECVKELNADFCNCLQFFVGLGQNSWPVAMSDFRRLCLNYSISVKVRSGSDWI